MVDKNIQCTNWAALETFDTEQRTDWFVLLRHEERACVELRNQYALRFQQRVLEAKAFSSTKEHLERLEQKFDYLQHALRSLKVQHMRNASTSTNGVLVRSVCIIEVCALGEKGGKRCHRH